MKKWYWVIVSLVLSFMPQLLFAAIGSRSGPAGGGKGLVYTPPPTGVCPFFQSHKNDLSMHYLNAVFGSVDGILHGTGGQIAGKMFSIFNSAAITLGGILIAYILVKSTVETAHEGEVLGKKWSTIWVPLRAALGFGLLIPKASGYSIIQIFMMWVVASSCSLNLRSLAISTRL